MLRTLLATLTLAGAALAAAPALAAVIGNGGPDLTGATDLNANLGADDFSLASASTISLIRFWTAQGSAADYAGSMEWSILADSAGAPGATVQSGSFVSTQTAIGLDIFGLPVFRHEATVDIALASGNYWLALHNGPSASPLPTEFYWAFQDGVNFGSAQAFELATAGPWGAIAAELAFELVTSPGGGGGNVPEPGSLALVCAGIALLGARRCRREA